MRTERLERLFDRVLAEHARVLRHLAAAYEADPALREDLLQDMALALWKALPRFRGEAGLATYVYRVAYNRAISHVAHQRARRSVDHPAGEAAEETPSPGASPEEATVGGETRRRLEAAVRRLRPSLREVVVLRLDGLRSKQIAEILGLTENNVAVRLSRARDELRRLISTAGTGGGR